tara:strand:+ start:1552 stop:1821 length:270 start_codon:yes stop_codon:yes gene_type:complete
MKMKEITNGSLYRDKETQDIVRARKTLNTSSVTVSKPHSDDLKAVKAKNLNLLSNEEVELYLKEAEIKEAKAKKNPEIKSWRQGFVSSH